MVRMLVGSVGGHIKNSVTQQKQEWHQAEGTDAHCLYVTPHAWDLLWPAQPVRLQRREGGKYTQAMFGCGVAFGPDRMHSSTTRLRHVEFDAHKLTQLSGARLGFIYCRVP